VVVVVVVADLGKVLLHPLFGAEPQYAVVGTPTSLLPCIVALNMCFLPSLL
jgi:hypothetical protein